MDFFNESLKGGLPKKDALHYIYPPSRTSYRQKGENNRVPVNHVFERRFQQLFWARTPEECLDFLVDYFWGGRIEILENYLDKRRSKTTITKNYG
ncbi:MAG: hypothetical protein KGY69_13195 [Bacteroidales bacterium]|nr:hypothetical protein [Bacteroidales bacterium]